MIDTNKKRPRGRTDETMQPLTGGERPEPNRRAQHDHYHGYRPADDEPPSNRNHSRKHRLAILFASFVTAVAVSLVASILINYELSNRPAHPYYSAAGNDTKIDDDADYPKTPQPIKDIAGRLRLTDRAKQIFYEHRPAIFAEADDPGFICTEHLDVNEQKTIQGCWTGRPPRIYLLDQAEQRDLDAAAGHEVLHAIYHDIFQNDQARLERLNAMIQAVYEQNQEELQDLLLLYEDLHGAQRDQDDPFVSFARDSELHSFIPAAVEQLPEDLEEHYALYFEDRSLLLEPLSRPE